MGLEKGVKRGAAGGQRPGGGEANFFPERGKHRETQTKKYDEHV